MMCPLLLAPLQKQYQMIYLDTLRNNSSCTSFKAVVTLSLTFLVTFFIGAEIFNCLIPCNNTQINIRTRAQIIENTSSNCISDQCHGVSLLHINLIAIFKY